MYPQHLRASDGMSQLAGENFVQLADRQGRQAHPLDGVGMVEDKPSSSELGSVQYVRCTTRRPGR